jgi:hypothetical protein
MGLPADLQVVAAAVEAGLDEREWPVPGGADRVGVEEALRRHMREVVAAEGARGEGSGS